MKQILIHIIASLFLLVFAGAKLLDVSNSEPVSYATTHIVKTYYHSIKAVEHKITKENHSDYSFPSIETDADDFQFSDSFIWVAALTKCMLFDFFLGHIFQKLKKRRFFYEAFIRIFSQKYIVLRTLRI